MKTMMTEKRWVKKYPDSGTGPLPTEPYVSSEYFELERERVFRRTWINVGRVEEIPKVADYMVRDLAVCNASILIVRGTDGVIRGFHNVCSHRANKVVWEERGSCPGLFECKFHSWGYTTEGQLKSIPDEENFFDVRKDELGLTPVATDVWEGFIFINLEPSPKESLKEYLDGVGEELKGSNFGELTLLQKYKVEEKANWKVALDAQNEVYHLPFQHRLMPALFTLKEGRVTRLLDFKIFGRHTVYSCEFNPKREMTPVDVASSEADSSITKCRLPMIGDFDFYVIYPNFVMIFFRGLYNDSALTYNFWPLAVDRTIWEIRSYFPPAQHAGQRFSQELMKTRNRDILTQDAKAHQTVQSGLATRAKRHFVLQDDEIQIRHFHRVMEEHVGFYKGA